MDQDRSKIDQLNSTLYSRTAPAVRGRKRHRLEEKTYNVTDDWEHKEEPIENTQLNTRYISSSMSFLNKLLIASILFFIIAIGLGAFFVLKGSNIVSADNVDIVISGPATIAGGDPIDLDIKVTNHNNIKLETVDLSIDFPAGSANPENPAEELKTFRELMKDIDPGGSDKKSVKAVIYGEENSKKELIVRVEYRVAGSNALFQKEKAYEVLISSSPLNLSVASFKEVTAGQEFEMALTLTSNSKEVLKNLLLKASYPFGYTFISSDIKTVGDNSTWKIGDIPPGGKKTIKIRGKLDAQDEESRTFRFTTGAWSATNDKVISTEYVAAVQDIEISKPFVSVDLEFDNDDGVEDYIGRFDDPIRVEVNWFNNLDIPITDAEISVRLSGSAYNKNSVTPDQGVFRSADDTIVWNGVSNRELRSLDAGSSGRVTFNIVPRDPSTATRGVVDPSIVVDVSVRGRRVSESDVPESINSTAKRTVRVASNIGLTSQIVRSTGPFENTGPIPPKAEEKTTYTVIWTIYNASSAVGGAEVRSSLPPYVSWAGKTSPSSEDISFDKSDGKVVWNIGTASPYTGDPSRRREVSFQITLEPSASQVGQTPVLLERTIFNAIDSYTGTELKSDKEEMDTRLLTDPSYKDGDDIVQP
jgi:Domain of unknown function DUF11